MIQTITNWLLTTISIITAFGVFVHDGHLDKAVMSGLDAPIDATHIAKGGHAHADYNAVEHLMNKSQGYQSPAVPPKSRSERKRRLQLPPEFGRHAFDDILMPMLA